ncbi:tryptophan synthase subunit beta [candidate division MSBL1 archaeon SCGC-AAA259O05]|uniref:tryptophan synthase n=1 Tax=candidate division MSBL1 archaeon SCGC-AAA259O05 TaxID=1698271 RepID=A0A133UYM1_9EURY|nr:tryptophan synthase subunit beta [candidate division MSBL1 archaeon SCGC-AAA259O05]
MNQLKFSLEESEIPEKWYNILPLLSLEPPLNPKSLDPAEKEDLLKIFAKPCVEQEMSQESWIDIPEKVRKIYRHWRPTPLFRARDLEDMIGTPAKIYYKYEGVSPPGSHKPNTAVAQAYYNKKEGMERVTTETGAGQWGSALSYGANQFDLPSTVYMVRISYRQKPDRRPMMEAWNGEVIPSPSKKTEAGKDRFNEDSENPGSLGIAIAEAIEDAAKHENVHYTIGSVLNHVLLHQTVIGLETKKQFKKAGDEPDIMIGCAGGGSSFAGFSLPFIGDVIEGEKNTNFRVVEPTACPSLTSGRYRYDFGDSAQETPLIKMYTLGHDFVPPPIHSGGLRYHGMAPIISKLVEEEVMEPVAVSQMEMFEAALEFSDVEGIIPAPEPGHAIQQTIKEAKRCRETGEEKTIAFLLCGHGHFDMEAYREYYSDELEHIEYPEDEIEKSMDKLPDVE